MTPATTTQKIPIRRRALIGRINRQLRTNGNRRSSLCGIVGSLYRRWKTWDLVRNGKHEAGLLLDGREIGTNALNRSLRKVKNHINGGVGFPSGQTDSHAPGTSRSSIPMIDPSASTVIFENVDRISSFCSGSGMFPKSRYF